MKILPFQSTIQQELCSKMYKSFDILRNENSTAIHNSEYVAKLPRCCAYHPIYLECMVFVVGSGDFAVDLVVARGCSF